MIPIAKPLIGEEEKNRVLEVMDSGMLAHGKYVEDFENDFARYCSSDYAVATTSGTTAIFLALAALGLKPGDEVITTPFTFIATASPIKMLGAKPVFVDIDPDTFNIDPSKIAEKINDKTKGIIPVHLYGLSADMDPILKLARENDLFVLEDACQAHGAEYKGKKVGTMGTVASFSFYPTKNMTTGEGGMNTTNDKELADNMRTLRNHGQGKRYDYVTLGYNLRMTNISAAIGIEQLKKLEGFIEMRRQNAKLLTDLLGDAVETPVEPKGYRHVYHQYTIKLPEGVKRDGVLEYLRQKGVGFGIYYPKPLYEYSPMSDAVDGPLPVSSDCAKRVISLPVHPALSEDDIHVVASVLREAL